MAPWLDKSLTAADASGGEFQRVASALREFAKSLEVQGSAEALEGRVAHTDKSFEGYVRSAELSGAGTILQFSPRSPGAASVEMKECNCLPSLEIPCDSDHFGNLKRSEPAEKGTFPNVSHSERGCAVSTIPSEEMIFLLEMCGSTQPACKDGSAPLDSSHGASEELMMLLKMCGSQFSERGRSSHAESRTRSASCGYNFDTSSGSSGFCALENIRSISSHVKSVSTSRLAAERPTVLDLPHNNSECRPRGSAAWQTQWSSFLSSSSTQSEENDMMFKMTEIESLAIRAMEEEWYLNPEDFEIQEKLGEGDCAVVYKAKWRSMTVVSKQLRSFGEYRSVGKYSGEGGSCREGGSCLSAATAREDLINEIGILSHLRHPNLVLFLGACMNQGSVCLISEYMEGGTIEDFYNARTAACSPNVYQAPHAQVIAWAKDLGQALCFLHNCKPAIIHRDLKPANLLIDSHMKLKVGDFSLSRVVSKDELTKKYNMTGRTGTVRYMAPEVMMMDNNGSSSYDEKVDVYSASLIIWYMCIGERPYGELPPDTVMRGVFRGLRPDVYSIVRHHGQAMADLITQGWSMDPRQRHSAGEMVQKVKKMREEALKAEQSNRKLSSPFAGAKKIMRSMWGSRKSMGEERDEIALYPDKRVHGGSGPGSSAPSRLEQQVSSRGQTLVRNKSLSSAEMRRALAACDDTASVVRDEVGSVSVAVQRMIGGGVVE